MIGMHVHRQLCLIILLLGIQEKVNTGELFSFVTSIVCLTVLFFNNQGIYCATFQTFMVSVQGGHDLSISCLKQSCFSHGEGSFKEPIHKQFYSK